LKDSDTNFYYEAKYYLQYKKDSLFFELFKKSKNLFLKDTLAVNFACQYFITNDERKRTFWFDSLLYDQNGRYICPIELMFKKSKKPSFSEIASIPLVLQEDYKTYTQAYRKKAVLAGLFSAIVPGSGKLYIGNYRSFLTTLTSNSLFFFQTRESYLNKSINHPFTIFNFSFLSGFYAVNIYGSYHETKQNKVNLKNHFFIHVANYYFNFSNRLY
jgi:hypothetical protein